MVNFSVAAFAEGERTYWPGFTGAVTQFLTPLDATRSEDRYFTMKIRFAAEPQAEAVAFDSAFHAVCFRHQGDLLRVARSLSPRNDWRLQVRFEWPVKSSNGINVSFSKNKLMRLSSCRFV